MHIWHRTQRIWADLSWNSRVCSLSHTAQPLLLLQLERQNKTRADLIELGVLHVFWHQLLVWVPHASAHSHLGSKIQWVWLCLSHSWVGAEWVLGFREAPRHGCWGGKVQAEMWESGSWSSDEARAKGILLLWVIQQPLRVTEELRMESSLGPWEKGGLA